LLLLGAVIALLAYIGAVWITDAAQARAALWELGWLGCLGVLSLSLLNYVLRFYRWQHYLAQLGRVLPVPLHFMYYLSGFAFTASPAKAGEAFRSLHLHEHGVAYSDSLAALFSERLLDLVAMCLLASLAAVEYVSYRPLVAGIVVAALVVLAMVRHTWLADRLDTLRPRMPRLLLKPLSTLTALLRSSRLLLEPAPMAIGLGIALLAWGAEGFGLYLICHSLHIDVTVTSSIGIYAVAALAGCAAFFMPAGIGGTEVVMTSLLMLHHSTLRTALVAALLCRIATLWFAVLVGIAASLAVELQLMPRPVRSAS
jgi:uncharacterized protein (TIRG00374 family)